MPDPGDPAAGPPNPLLRGEKVYLRPIEPDDADLVHAWYEDAETARLMGEFPRSLAGRRADATSASTERGRDSWSFIICLVADDRPVGRADLFAFDRLNGSVGFGLMIGDRAARGGGLGVDAVNAMVDFCFGQLRCERVWLVTDSANLRAQHVYEKAGFAHEGRLREAFYQDGRFQDDIRMAMLRSEWEALDRKRSWEFSER
jgi:RimJ/RimL family protein N-acetyltransferase